MRFCFCQGALILYSKFFSSTVSDLQLYKKLNLAGHFDMLPVKVVSRKLDFYLDCLQG
jgi:hypothetical protein